MKRTALFLILFWLISFISNSQEKENILSSVKQSIAALTTDIVIGYGVCISPNLVVSPISTIGNYSYGQVKLSDGKYYGILGYTFVDTDNDFVLLKINADSASPIKLAVYSPHVGQKVFLTIKNEDNSVSLIDGKLTNLKDFGVVKLIEVKSSVQYNSIGLPVLDSAGNIIAMSVKAPVVDSNSNYSISVELIIQATEKQEELRNLSYLHSLVAGTLPKSAGSKSKDKADNEFINLGIKRLDQKDYSGAIEKFNMAIRLNPADADAYAFRGQAKIMLTQFKDALTDFNKAIELQPEFAEALDMRGICKAELGDKAGACEDWKLSYQYGYNPAFDLLENFCDLNK